jgi:hypothetical protein
LAEKTIAGNREWNTKIPFTSLKKKKNGSNDRSNFLLWKETICSDRQKMETKNLKQSFRVKAFNDSSMQYDKAIYKDTGKPMLNRK